METESLKALALKVLQRNSQGNSMETELKKQGNSMETFDMTSWLDKLTDVEREIFEERSAIMEYDGGLDREIAEVEAIKAIIKKRGEE